MIQNKIIYDYRLSSITSIIAIILVILCAIELASISNKTHLIVSALVIVIIFYFLLWLKVFSPKAQCSSCNKDLRPEISKNYKDNKKQGLPSCPYCGVTFEGYNAL